MVHFNVHRITWRTPLMNVCLIPWTKRSLIDLNFLKGKVSIVLIYCGWICRAIQLKSSAKRCSYALKCLIFWKKIKENFKFSFQYHNNKRTCRKNFWRQYYCRMIWAFLHIEIIYMEGNASSPLMGPPLSQLHSGNFLWRNFFFFFLSKLWWGAYDENEASHLSQAKLTLYVSAVHWYFVFRNVVDFNNFIIYVCLQPVSCGVAIYLICCHLTIKSQCGIGY